MQRGNLVDTMVQRLADAAGQRLESVVLYGPEAHGDVYRTVGDLNLMIVLSDLEPETIAPLGRPVHWWLRKGQPWPRLFSPALIRDSVDVYPMEFLDLCRHRRVLHGDDPLAGIDVDATLLRLQCERELREKLMRLREGYVESRGRPRGLRRLLAASYASFAPVWRGLLHLLGAGVPAHDAEVARALCERLGLDPAPFDEVARVAGGRGTPDAEGLFSRYYRELTEAVERIDRLTVDAKGHVT